MSELAVEPAAAVVSSAPVAVAAELEPEQREAGALLYGDRPRRSGLPTGQRKRKQKIFESSTHSPRRLSRFVSPEAASSSRRIELPGAYRPFLALSMTLSA